MLSAGPAQSGETAQPALKPNEAKIVAALDEKTELEFVDQPLSDVIDFLKERHGIEIQLDHNALTDEGVGSDTPITKNVKGISLESALDLVLGDLKLAYAVRDEVLFITSKEVAEHLLQTKTYPVADLVAREDGAALGDDYQGLVELIASSVAPTTWNEVGGPGSIQEFRNARALVVSQTFATHRQIERLLASVREVREAQAAADPKQAEDEVQDDQTLYVKVYRLPAAWAGPAAMRSGGAAGGGSAASAQPAAANPSPPAQGKNAGETPAPKHVHPQFGMGGMGGGMVRAQTTPASPFPTADELSKAIPAVVAPESWDLSGGPGSIRAAGNSLIVRQTRPVHGELARLLGELK
jgi:hypothetical protein